MEDLYTVWVGGTEVIDHYVTKDKAEVIAEAYEEDDYEDVQIEKI